ncbi:hypothetical protein D0Y65_026576 [Glycine soja]|uniref:Uncharacterized protein n=1 Tax=Glycine soja TaxID=3848 RepID=A0A445IKI1_GLYSO|nr:hypothetical protein D0Y65_026576 [Glycine soja]
MPISPCGSISWDRAHKTPSGPGEAQQGLGVSSSGYGPLSVLQGIAPARHQVDSEKSNRVLGFLALITGLCALRDITSARGWPRAGNRRTATTSRVHVSSSSKKVRALPMTHGRPAGDQVQSQRGGEPDDRRRQIMVIHAPFAIQRRSSPMERRDKLWSFCTFCHPEAASPMIGGDKLWSSAHLSAIQRRSSLMARIDKLWSLCTFCHPEAVGPMTCGEPFGPALFHLLSSSGGGPDDMRGTIWCHTFSPFVIQRRRV